MCGLGKERAKVKDMGDGTNLLQFHIMLQSEVVASTNTGAELCHKLLITELHLQNDQSSNEIPHHLCR